MLQTLPGFEPLAYYFFLELLLPVLLFVLSAYLFWRLQSKIVLFAYYKLVLPVLRQNRILYWLFGGLAVASHEILGHVLVGAVTGSDATMAEGFTPERGQVRIAHKQSAGGLLSALLATLAPCFAPPALLLLLFILLFPATLSFDALDPSSLLDTTLANFFSIISLVFNSDLANPATLVFIYLLASLSLTSGASSADFKIVLSQSAKYPHFFLFILLAFSLSLELLRILAGLSSASQLFFPFACFALLSFLVILSGITLAMAFASYLKFIASLPFLLKILSFLAFPATYLSIAYSTLSFPLPFYLSALAISSVFLFLWSALLKLISSRFFRNRPSKPSPRLKMRSLRRYEQEV